VSPEGGLLPVPWTRREDKIVTMELESGWRCADCGRLRSDRDCNPDPTEQKRQGRSVRRTEKPRCRAKMTRVSSSIRPTQGDPAAAGTIQPKSLISRQIRE